MAVQLNVWGRRLTANDEDARAERGHLERSLAERFNFFLVWVGLVTNAAFEVPKNERAIRVVLLILGLVVSTLLWSTLRRTYAKLLFTLAIMRGACTDHAGRFNHDSPPIPWRPSKEWLSRQDEFATRDSDKDEIVISTPKLSQLAKGVMFYVAYWVPLACIVGFGVLLCMAVACQ